MTERRVDEALNGSNGIFLTEQEVAARWRGVVSPGTLRNWRSQGRGPLFVKIGRAVLYPVSGLEAWEGRRTARGGSAPD